MIGLGYGRRMLFRDRGRPPRMFRPLVVCGVLISFAGSCWANGSFTIPGFGPAEVFGEIARQAQTQGAARAWARVTQSLQACFAKALARDGYTLAAVLQSGMMPDDPALQAISRECHQFDEANLRKSYPCTVQDETHQVVSTTCDQFFRRSGAEADAAPLSAAEAMDLHFSGQSPVLGDFETAEARQSRVRRSEIRDLASSLASLRARLLPFEASPSGPVQREMRRLSGQIARALQNPESVDRAMVDDLGRSVAGLSELSASEAQRLAVLDAVGTIRRIAEQRTGDQTPQTLKTQLAALEVEYAALSSPPLIRASPAGAGGRRIGASYDCTKATTSVPKTICADDLLARLDVEMLRPYYILRALYPAQIAQLDGEAREFSTRTLQLCKGLEGTRLKGCIEKSYRAQTIAWRARVLASDSVFAKQELARSIESHVLLQRALKTRGLLAPDAIVDGVYGGGTRKALVEAQRLEGIASEGFMSDAMAERVAGYAQTSSAQPSGGEDERLDRLEALRSRFVAYVGSLNDAERDRLARTSAAATLEEARKSIAAVLDKPLPARIKNALADFSGVLSDVGPGTEIGRLTSFVDQFGELRATLAQAQTIVRATSALNAFLFDGADGDVFFLYNQRPDAPSVFKDLHGAIVFDRLKTRACSYGALPDPPAAVWQMSTLFREIQAPVKLPLQPCTAGPESYDLVLLRRGSLLAGSTDALVRVLAALDTGTLALLRTISTAEFEAHASREGEIVSSVAADVENSRASGFAFLVLPRRPDVLCTIVGRDREVHDLALSSARLRLEAELGSSVQPTDYSLEEAFLAAKRGRCGAIYASMSDLHGLAAALQRDHVGFAYLPATVSIERLAEIRQHLLRIEIADAKDREEPAPFLAQVATTSAPSEDSSKQSDRLEPATEVVRPSLATYGGKETSEATLSPKRAKLALVIGNSRYSALRPLDNPVHDAEDIASELSSIGFSVTLSLDAKRDRIEEDLAGFAKAARQSQVALVYFAGHGFQISGNNYLVPVDGRMDDPTDLQRMISVSGVVDDLENAPGAKILILDACRENEQLDRLMPKTPAVRGASATRGLARNEAKGVFIAYSTQPGSVAQDGEGTRNSPFASALLKFLPLPGVDLRVMFTRVRQSVNDRTEGRQTPEVADSLLGEFQFN